MTKEKFHTILLGSSFFAFKFAERFVRNKLVPEFRYDVFLQGYEENPDPGKFDIYPEDANRVERGLIDREAVELVYRAGKVPVWIDISVEKASRKLTTLHLRCAGNYSDDPSELYYRDGGTEPFGIKSPLHPINYQEGKRWKLKS